MNRDDEFPDACLETFIIDVWFAKQDFLVDTPSACRGVRSLHAFTSISYADNGRQQ